MSTSYQFLPTLDRITDEPPHKGAITVARIVMVLIAVLILWSFLGRLDMVVVAEGRLVPETYVKIVQPAEAGVVREILVKEGDAVKQGQVLARLDDTMSVADTTTLRQGLALKRMELRRINAEIRGVPFLPKAGDDLVLFRQVRDHYRAHRGAFEDGLGGAEAQREKSAGELAAARQQISRLEQLLPVYRKELASYEAMRAKGYVSELDYNEKERAVINASEDLAAQRSTVVSLEAALRQSERQRSQVISAYQAELEQERVPLTGDIQALEQDVAKQAHRNEQLELRAPQDGVVKDLATHTIGTVVQPGTILMTLVPVHERLLAEVYVRNEDVGNLRPGLPVKIKVNAFRFQRYGMLGGEIVTLGADSSVPQQDQQGGGNAPALYKAIVLVKHVGDGAIDAQPLAAGMTVTAEIDVGTRTPFEYLVDPVRGTLQRAGVEP